MKDIKAEIFDLVNTPNKFGFMMLQIAVDKGMLNLAKVLIKYGAKNIPNREGLTPLAFLLMPQNTLSDPIKKLMLKIILNSSENNINHIHPIIGTPLHLAGTLDDIEYAKILLAHGADRTLVDKDKKNALQRALEMDLSRHGEKAYKKYIVFSFRVKKNEELSIAERLEFAQLKACFKHYHQLKKILDAKPDLETKQIQIAENLIEDDKSPLVSALLELNHITLLFDYSGEIITEEKFANLFKRKCEEIWKLIQACKDCSTAAAAAIILGHAYLGNVCDVRGDIKCNVDTIVNDQKNAIKCFQWVQSNLEKVEDKILKKELLTYVRTGLYLSECYANYHSGIKRNSLKVPTKKNQQRGYLNDRYIKNIAEIYNKYFHLDDLNQLILMYNAGTVGRKPIETNISDDTVSSYPIWNFIAPSTVLDTFLEIFTGLGQDLSETLNRKNFDSKKIERSSWNEFYNYLTILEKVVQHICEILTLGTTHDKTATIAINQLADFSKEHENIAICLTRLKEEKKKYEKISKKNSEDFLNALAQKNKVKTRYFKSIKNEQKSLTLQVENASTPSNNQKSTVEEPKHHHNEAEDLYNQGKFEQAKDLYVSLLPEKIESINRLEYVKIKMGIGDCLAAMMNWEKKFGSEDNVQSYSKQAVEHYSEAMLHAQQGKEENENSSSIYHEFESYRYFINANINSLNDKESEFLDDLEYEVNEISECIVSPKEAQVKISEETKLPIDKSEKKKSVSFLPNQKLEINLNKEVEFLIKSINDLGLSQSKHENRNYCFAYIVGGAVLDFMLNKIPNDIDLVIRDISLHDIKLLLNNLRIPFKILATRYSPVLQIQVGNIKLDIVACCASDPQNKDKMGITLDNGLFALYSPTSSIEIDTTHRDFTVKSFYYDTVNKVIIDGSGRGFNHLKEKSIQTIQEPAKSFSEDPSRMLRAIDLSTKQNFLMGREEKKFIQANTHLLNKMTNRQFQLCLKKLFLQGNALKNYKMLNELGLINKIFPAAQSLNKNFVYKTMVEKFFNALDSQYELYSKLSLLLSVMLWFPLKQTVDQYKFNEPQKLTEAINYKIAEILSQQQSVFALPEFILTKVQEIWKAVIFGTSCISSLDNYVSYLQFSNLINSAELKLHVAQLTSMKNDATNSHNNIQQNDTLLAVIPAQAGTHQ